MKRSPKDKITLRNRALPATDLINGSKFASLLPSHGCARRRPTCGPRCALAAPNKYLAQNDKSSDGRKATNGTAEFRQRDAQQAIEAQKKKNDMQRIKPYAQYALAILGIAAFDLLLPAWVYALHLYLDAPQ